MPRRRSTRSASTQSPAEVPTKTGSRAPPQPGHWRTASTIGRVGKCRLADLEAVFPTVVKRWIITSALDRRDSGAAFAGANCACSPAPVTVDELRGLFEMSFESRAGGPVYWSATLDQTPLLSFMSRWLVPSSQLMQVRTSLKSFKVHASRAMTLPFMSSTVFKNATLP